MTKEEIRLAESRTRKKHWERWGPYLSERAWGTVRPVFGKLEKFQTDPHWRDLLLFHEYFHGDSGSGVGASHQTGWTGLVTKLMQQSGEFREGKKTEPAPATVPASGIEFRDGASVPT